MVFEVFADGVFWAHLQREKAQVDSETFAKREKRQEQRKEKSQQEPQQESQQEYKVEHKERQTKDEEKEIQKSECVQTNIQIDCMNETIKK